MIKNGFLIFRLGLLLTLLDQERQTSHITILMVYVFIDHHFACCIHKSLSSLFQFLKSGHAGQIIYILQRKLVHIIHKIPVHPLII